jgi:hypothetical protein
MFEWCFVLPDGDALRWWEDVPAPLVGDIVRLEEAYYSNEGSRDELTFRVRAREWEQRRIKPLATDTGQMQLKLYVHLEEPDDG